MTDPDSATDGLPVYVGGTRPGHLLGELVPVDRHGVQHWRYVSVRRYQSPFLYTDRGGAAGSLVSQHFAADTEGGAVVPRVEVIEGAPGVGDHLPAFESLQCTARCPEHPPVIICAADGHTWPCAAVHAVCVELEHQATQFGMGTDGEGRDAADQLRARARDLATAGGRL